MTEMPASGWSTLSDGISAQSEFVKRGQRQRVKLRIVRIRVALTVSILVRPRHGPEYLCGGQKAHRLNELPVNHSRKFAPVIHPTLRTGVEALVVATRAWLPD
jgi:hypothetical protein